MTEIANTALLYINHSGVGVRRKSLVVKENLKGKG